MQVAVLGPLEVRTDDLLPVPVAGAAERLLLAVLTAGAPAPAGTDRLVDVLRDGEPPAAAHAALRAHAVPLRASPDRRRAAAVGRSAPVARDPVRRVAGRRLRAGGAAPPDRAARRSRGGAGAGAACSDRPAAPGAGRPALARARRRGLGLRVSVAG